MKKKNFYIFSIVIVILLIYGVTSWDDYREKTLADLLDTSKIEKIYYNQLPIKDEKAAYNRQLTDDKAIQELISYLSQYRVKKIGDRDFVSEYPDEQFIFQLEYEDDQVTTPSLIERDVLLNDQYQYEITNGPVDYQWLEEFLMKNGEEL
ncbi:hypothetical protein LC048_10310 [Mesobacillus subterraneus]|uniref:hypothetical protein n=1 Tax=Mesobacillus subterraneus TaxID=285983 RepID=UPI00273F688C|nr:hypothetical protein [Mesobacillus subterraneus]WLR57213.1 hypothetical protein LC048_10310 [Mesobacillus subterraneus]